MGRIPQVVVVADVFKALALAAFDDEVSALLFSSRKYIGRELTSSRKYIGRELTNTFPVR
jgi:hypothetical protein